MHFPCRYRKMTSLRLKKPNNSRETLTCNQYQWPNIRNQGVSMMMLQWCLTGYRFVLGYTWNEWWPKPGRIYTVYNTVETHNPNTSVRWGLLLYGCPVCFPGDLLLLIPTIRRMCGVPTAALGWGKAGGCQGAVLGGRWVLLTALQ